MTYQPPTAPIPVAPLAWPAPPPPRRGRPGIVTAMGIISIVVACMSALTNFAITMMAFGVLAGSRAPATWTPPSRPMNATVQTLPSGATAVIGGIQVEPGESEDGIEEAQRPMVISGMVRARALDEGRRKQLDLLLTVAGRSMFPFISPGTQPQTIRANVSDSGRLPSASGKTGPDYYIIGTGRVEVYDTHAIFRPDGSANVVSVSMPTGDGSSSNTSANPGLPPGANMPAPPAPVKPIPNPLASVNPASATLTMIGGMLSLLLALYLLIIGIMTVRDSRSGGKLHWGYVLMKVPVVVLTIGASVWLASSFMKGLTASANAAAANAPPGAPPAAQTAAAGVSTMVTFWIVLLAAAALAYPLALIPVLLSKTVRRYYSKTPDD